MTCISLASNENPLGPSPAAIAAATSTLQHAHHYPDGTYYGLKCALATHLGVEPQQITIGNGSENILELITKAYLLQHDDSVVLSQYTFRTIPFIVQSYGVRIITVPVQAWHHDINALIAAIEPTTKVLFLVNPNNPTGTYATKNELLMLLNAVPKEVLIVVDEAYYEYVTAADYPHTLTYLAHYPNLIITRTFSKAYGLAALRLGYAISSPTVATMLEQMRLPYYVNAIAVHAALAALADTQHVQKSVAMNHAGLQQLQIGLRALQLHYIQSIANFITIEVPNAEYVCQQLLQAGIAVCPLHAYGMLNYFRVTVGTSEQNASFLSALKKIL